MIVRARVALLVAAVVLTGGCSEGAPARPTSSAPAVSSESTQPRETPTADPLAIPDAMRDKSLKGAEAAVRHYFDTYNHLIKTGDAKPIKRLYGSYCSVCSAYVGLVEGTYERGNSARGTQSLMKVRAYSGSKGLAFVLGTSSGPSVTEVFPDGQTKMVVPGGRVTLQYNLAFHNGRWSVVRIEVPE